MIALEKIEHGLRPLLARVVPPSLFMKTYSAGRGGFIKKLAKELIEAQSGDYRSTKVAGLTFRNDLGNAAGLDKDGSLLDFNHRLGAGFTVLGTVLNKPHTGNLFKAFGGEHNPWTPLPNSRSALNSLGLPSKGIDSLIDTVKEFQDRVQPKNFPIGISTMGHPTQSGQEKIDGVLECVKKSMGTVDFIEINESCPNVKGHDSAAMIARVKAVMDVAGDELPIFIKLGNLAHAEETLCGFAELGVAGVVLLNTQKNYPLYEPKLNPADKKIFKFYTEKFEGGLSGEIIRDTSFDAVKLAKSIIDKETLKLELIHVGGIGNSADVAESREYAALREWYSLFMERLFEWPLKDIYSKMTL